MREEDIIEGMTVSHKDLGLGIVLERYKWAWEMDFWWLRKWKRKKQKGVVEVVFLFSSPAVRMNITDLEVICVDFDIQKEIHEKAVGFTPTLYGDKKWSAPSAGYRRQAMMKGFNKLSS